MKIGLVVNPLAGLGGPAALKGSDALDTAEIAGQRGVASRIGERIGPALTAIGESNATLIVAPGVLGADWCHGLEFTTIDLAVADRTSADDTKKAVQALSQMAVDLLVFAGGDGTARDVMDASTKDQVVLGIPCGVKMHSAVFANNPNAAAAVIKQMISGDLLSVSHAEVRDIDEAAFQQGIVRASFYGEMWVPEELKYMQQVKSGGKEVEALVVEEIAADVIEGMESGVTYFMGSGSTTAAIMAQLGIPNTLLGVDVVKDNELILSDAYEAQLFELAEQGPSRIVLTVIGGQGHLFGRGNQQLSPRVLRAVGQENLIVVATKSKLEALPAGIVVDTGDAALDQSLSGFIRITTGYEDTVLCPVRC